MSGLHFMSLLELLHPSQPASTENGTLIPGLEVLQLVVDDLHHVYDVHGWCLDA